MGYTADYENAPQGDPVPNAVWVALAIVAPYLFFLRRVPAEARLNPQALRGRIQAEPGLQLVDVRTPEEFQGGHLKGAKNIPVDQLQSRAGELSKDKPLALYCRSGSRSASALRIVTGLGFKSAQHLEGGIMAWQREGLPLS